MTKASNKLSTASSPYLLQHSDNPVHWQEWGINALQQAKEENKPILLSIGYAACHWCHVMAHESFEDQSTADIMNELFVNIKVDREERPDIDQIYMSALHAMGEQGGWPLTAFLTPDGSPFFGGTYFPPKAGYGRPAFKDVINAISRAYHEDKASVLKNSNALSAHLEKLSGSPNELNAPPQNAFGSFAERSLSLHDPENGGTQGAPKFPNAPILETWLRNSKQTGTDKNGTAFVKSIEKISSGGIYDHLLGGIARYTVDDKWLVPHFEKMLYDNAHYLRHLLWAEQISNQCLFRARIEETIKWLETEMTHADGGFFSSLDADSEGEEGKFYVWDATEVKSLLGHNFTEFAKAYDVTEGGNWEGKTILNQLHINNPDNGELHKGSREILLQERAKRIRPGLDDKILTDWNAYMIRALAELAGRFPDSSYLTLAENAFRFICESSPDKKHLNHSWRNGKTIFPPMVTDYAAMCNAALSLYEVTGQDLYLEKVATWIATLDDEYSDGAGGYFLTSATSKDTLVRPRCETDDPNPSPASQLLEVLVRYGHIREDQSAIDQAHKLAANIHSATKNQQYGGAGFYNSLQTLHQHQLITVFNCKPDGDSSLIKAIHNNKRPRASIRWVETNEASVMGNEIQIAGSDPTVIICANNTCSMPITDIDEVERLLAG